MLAILLVLLGTQVAYLVWPRRPNYLLRLAVSVAAFILGELAAIAGMGRHPAVGDLHPAVDLAFLAILQAGLTRWRGGDGEPMVAEPRLGSRRSR